ncbi:transposase [Wolbachia endosymbiont of Frankliniella intonsa]|uniref:transposase n=1 Tax=Wolbachia endosymbiont of Frankliniella intonsa TaxID=2902422 RepID=UPI00244E6B0A|nr:transposase [Wolbachia endosymbiont of Frankliniella intonsa]WGJ62190.1 transposase [Wolbachia endosymbiont of Frankliniella intonsa]
MPFIPRYFTYSSMTFSPLFSICSFYSGNWYEKEVFNILLEKMLLPKLPLGTTIVMDNATFHKTTKTKSLIESFGFHVLYLPTYSPDLNPIEHCWHTIKSRLRPLMYKCTDLQLLVGNTIMEIYPFILENTIV